MRESDILHEVGSYWVGRNRRVRAYVVFKNGPTHSVSDSAYCMNPNGLSIAIARANYLAKREEEQSRAQHGVTLAHDPDKPWFTP
jgi:hypothetical protein